MPFTKWRRCTTVLTRYGCPFPCTFCNSRYLPGQERAIDDVLEELQVVARMGIPEVYIRDFTFGPTRQRAQELSRRIAEAGLGLRWSAECRMEVLDEETLELMRDAGCEVILIGLETGDEKVASSLGKRVRESRSHAILQKARDLGIRACGHFVLGCHDESREQIESTVRLAKMLPLDYASFNLYAPRLATDLRRRLIEEGKLQDGNLDDQDVSLQANSFARVDSDELRRLFRWAVLSFFLRPSQIMRLLRSTPWSALARQGTGVVAGRRRGETMSVRGEACNALTVVIPALDEGLSIASTIEEIRAAFAATSIDLEILVVDDGSTDDTAKRAAAAGARVVSHPHRSGYGRSLKTGIAAASHGTIAICDGDATYPVEELPAMLELLREHDLVIGARTGPEYRGTFLRSPFRAAFLVLASFVAGQWIPDPNSGLRVFRRADVEPLFPDLPRGFSFTTTQTLIMTLAGAFIHYREIDYRPRVGRSKIRVFRHSLQIAQGLTEVVLRHNPLKLFLLLGMVPALAAIVAFALSCGSRAHAEIWLIVGTLWSSAAVVTFALGMLAAVVLRRSPTRSD